MTNITVRTDGIINNTLTEKEFVNITSQLFGEGKSLDEYLSLYNDSPQAKKAGIVVHKEVPENVAQKGNTDSEEQDIYLDAATQTFSDTVGEPADIEFANDD